MTDGDARRARFAWKITVKEVSGRPQVVGGVVKMMDCEMFPIAEESLKLTRLEAYQQIVLTGDTQIIGDRANKVGRYSVGIGTPNAPPQNPSQQTQSRETSLPKADVVVVSSTLRLRASSELWLVGTIFNRGYQSARNVKIVPILTNLHGTRFPAFTIRLDPADIAPRIFVDFAGRVALSGNPNETIARATVEWDP